MGRQCRTRTVKPTTPTWLNTCSSDTTGGWPPPKASSVTYVPCADRLSNLNLITSTQRRSLSRSVRCGLYLMPKSKLSSKNVSYFATTVISKSTPVPLPVALLNAIGVDADVDLVLPQTQNTEGNIRPTDGTSERDRAAEGSGLLTRREKSQRGFESHRSHATQAKSTINWSHSGTKRSKKI